MTRTRPAHGLLAIYPHITGRDRKIMRLLDDHQVLTTDHITRLFFHAPRTCRHRLGELHGLGLLDRFRFARPAGGTGPDPYRWAPGHEGQQSQAAARADPEPTARASNQRIARLSANPNLTHLLTVNEFFVRLAEHARRQPHANLVRWWSEAATKAFQTKVMFNPDGHGLWTVGERTVGFWLEADTGSEPLTRVVAKLVSYRKIVRSGGPRYPVLFWLASPIREEHLHRLLHTEYADVPTATATHDTNPAEAVWLPGDGHHRVRLEQLPAFHGTNSLDNPNYRNGVLVLGPTAV
ncbi:replication-relaxation family protein [Micromonospora sp. CPCC 205371]|nr:replication-relaxation family protein [Micromonospora sp. CPCC 205371]